MKCAASTNRAGSHCQFCLQRKVCLLNRMTELDGSKELGKQLAAKTVRKDHFLFTVGDAVPSLHVVQAGSLKTSLITRSGEAQITGFHLPGDMVGLDSLESARHLQSAEALQDTVVCSLPYSALLRACNSNPQMLQAFIHTIGTALRRCSHHVYELGKLNSEQRVATFLATMGRRLGHRDHEPERNRQIRLSMSRYDIANYLGLAVETVCRCLRRLENDGLMEVRRRQMSILDIDSLMRLAEPGLGEERVGRRIG